MNKRVLITGGAGFLGSHLADALLAYGYQVRVLDVLSPQVHGMKEERPTYLHPEVEFVCEAICHADAVRQALRGVSAVFHLAASVGPRSTTGSGARMQYRERPCVDDLRGRSSDGASARDNTSRTLHYPYIQDGRYPPLLYRYHAGTSRAGLYPTCDSGRGSRRDGGMAGRTDCQRLQREGQRRTE